MKQANHQDPSRSRVEPDFFPPGSRVCFVCLSDPELDGLVRGFFEKAGYLTPGISDVEIARQKLRINQYQMVVVESCPEFREIFQEIGSWPGNKRKEVNFVVMGRKAASLHQQMAFVLGANYYLNMDDVQNLEDLINQTIAGYNEYYQPWTQAMEQLNAG